MGKYGNGHSCVHAAINILSAYCCIPLDCPSINDGTVAATSLLLPTAVQLSFKSSLTLHYPGLACYVWYANNEQEAEQALQHAAARPREAATRGGLMASSCQLPGAAAKSRGGPMASSCQLPGAAAKSQHRA